jgi:hypothetical protein
MRWSSDGKEKVLRGLDKTLREQLSFNKKTDSHKVVRRHDNVLGGDFWQLIPIVRARLMVKPAAGYKKMSAHVARRSGSDGPEHL